MRKCQVLAPAGSTEQLICAVNNGCDAVYLGLNSFNARMKAPNFTAENIRQWVDYCHFFGVKVYVAVNTSIKNGEFDDAVKTLLCAYDNNADGAILTDLALIKYASTLPKPFEIVASTQLNCHDKFGAQFLKELGATTVVCSRECSLDNVRAIASTGVDVEVFIHGALCVCQSGQCLFSSMVGGNSGNRGLCAQPCRKLYSANGGEYKYLLSARDMCGLNTAHSLADVGATTFKIEGRNRRAEYAGATSRVYKKLFDNGFDCDEDDYKLLQEMYNRSMSRINYIDGDNADIIYPHCQNHSGVTVGTVAKNGIFATTALQRGDGVKVFDGQKEVCGGVVTTSGIGFVTAQFDGKVRDGYTVNRTTSVSLCNGILSAKRKLPVTVTLVAKVGTNAKLTAVCGDVEVNVIGNFVVQQAQNCPTSKEELAQQLQKLGDMPYTISNTEIDIDNIFVAKSQINGLRRDLFDKLSQKIVENFNKQFDSRKNRCEYKPALQIKTKRTDNALAVICYNSEQAHKIDGVNYVIYKPQFINKQTLQQVADITNCYLDLPSFADLDYIAELVSQYKTGIVCHNVGHVQLARTLHLPYIAGQGLNIFNDQIAQVFDDADTFVYSYELTLSEIGDFANGGGLTFVDGKIPLMKLMHCPFKVATGCNCNSCKANNKLVYTDQMGNNFEIARRRDKHCTFEVINGNKLSATQRLNVAGRYLVDFDEKIVTHYKQLNSGVNDGYTELAPYTKGRLYSKIN